MQKKPDFIIIGSMKCATSSLHEQLAVQPGLFMSELKEPNFFSSEIEYSKGWQWYLSLFTHAQATDICGESSTHYTKLPTYPKTIERILKHLPDTKFIYIMRHPIDRLVSQYVHEVTEKLINIDINQAIYEHSELIDYSRYTMQLEPYFDTFGSAKILPIFFERMLSHPQAELSRVGKFINYSGNPLWQENIEPQNVSSERLIKSAWRDFLVEMPGLKQVRQNFIPKSFRNWVKSFWQVKDKPQLTAKNIEVLQGIFDKDLAKLGNWLGTELNCQNFKEVVKANSWDWSESIQSTPNSLLRPSMVLHNFSDNSQWRLS
ncbi:MAG: sulfotransferase family protein [Microcoleaceae cyanobacterium]